MSKEDFYSLTPDEVMKALEIEGFSPTGQFTQLNSYENRVFDIHLEPGTREAPRVIVKFYRPGRWNELALLDEHGFINDLALAGLPVVAPLRLRNGKTIRASQNIWFTVFPRALGRMVDEFQIADFHRLGRTLAHLHNVGAARQARNRPILTTEAYGDESLRLLQSWIAPEVINRYNKSAEYILARCRDPLNKATRLRIHGDCHRGNILKTDFKDRASEFFLVDFDDCCTGPAIQDFWMLLSEAETSEIGVRELNMLLEGYTELRHFNDRELQLIPLLRGLRILYYAAWIARRWEDPSFPQIFPQFLEYDYWSNEATALERIAGQV